MFHYTHLHPINDKIMIRGEYMKLGECNFCLTKYEKDILTIALNSAQVDAEKTLNQTYRGEVTVGMPKAEVEEKLTRLIGDYRQLKDRVEKTPICP